MKYTVKTAIETLASFGLLDSAQVFAKTISKAEPGFVVGIYEVQQVSTCIAEYSRGEEFAREKTAQPPPDIMEHIVKFATSCAALNDHEADAYLARTGRYSLFDNPDCVAAARELLAKLGEKR